MWYAKMYFSEGREIFQYDSLGTQGVPDVQKEFPFLESLLAFQELDCAEVTPILQSITDNWSRFIAEDDRDALENFKRKLGRLAPYTFIFDFSMFTAATASQRCTFKMTEAVRRMRRYWTSCASSLNSFRCISSRSNAFLSWCWM